MCFKKENEYSFDIPIGYPSCPGFSKVKEEDSLKKTVKVIRNGRRNPRNSGNLEIKGKKKKNVSRNWCFSHSLQRD